MRLKSLPNVCIPAMLKRQNINSSLATEVQKLGCRTMEEVVAAARRIERILGEQPDSKMEQIVLSMQDQIRILTKDLKKAHEQMAPQAAAAIPTAALTASPAATVAAAQLLPIAPPPVMTPAQLPPTAPLPPLLLLSRLLTHLAASCTLIMGKKAPIIGPHADSPTEGLLAASCATRRAILPIAALPAPCCSAYYGSKPEKPPMAHPEARFFSSPRQKAARAPPRDI